MVLARATALTVGLRHCTWCAPMASSACLWGSRWVLAAPLTLKRAGPTTGTTLGAPMTLVARDIIQCAPIWALLAAKARAILGPLSARLPLQRIFLLRQVRENVTSSAVVSAVCLGWPSRYGFDSYRSGRDIVPSALCGNQEKEKENAHSFWNEQSSPV